MSYVFSARSIALAAVAFAAACSAPPPRGATSAALGAAEAAASAVAVLDSGHYLGTPIGDGHYYDSIWVDLSVRNDAYDKEVGIVWSNDGWQTSHVAAAQYEGALADGRERWGVDVEDAAVRGAAQTEVEYAGFATMNGRTAWSAFRNHYIYDRVTPAAPLLLLRSGAALDAGGRVAVHGVVRALNVTAPRRVFVRYTLDGWRRFGEVEARYDGPDFAFDLPVDGDAAAIDEAEFALRLEAGGETAWENDGGQNFHMQLAPRLASSRVGNAPGGASAGPKLILGQLQSSLPITAVRLRFDDGAVLDLPPSQDTQATRGFDAGGSFRAALATDAFSDGTHGFVVEASAGPFTRTFDGATWAVDHGIRAAGGAPVGQGETPWDFAVAPNGHTLVLTDAHLYDYATLDAAPAVFETASPTGLGQLAVDHAGHVYALGGTRLRRWNDDGALDRGFGRGGELELQGTWGGTALCYPADLAADPSGFVVVDSCNARLLRFGVDGGFVDAFSIADATGLTFALRAERVGDRLWVSASRFRDGASHWELLELATPAGAPMQLDARHPVDGDVEFFAVAPDGFWTTWGSDLYRLGPDGARRATWTGLGNADASLPGNLGIARRVIVGADGSAAVLSVESARIERFTAGGAPWSPTRPRG